MLDTALDTSRVVAHKRVVPDRKVRMWWELPQLEEVADRVAIHHSSRSHNAQLWRQGRAERRTRCERVRQLVSGAGLYKVDHSSLAGLIQRPARAPLVAVMRCAVFHASDVRQPLQTLPAVLPGYPGWTLAAL